MSMLRIQLLGGFAVHVGERLVLRSYWRQRRAAAIVKLLALESSHRLHREQLLEILWPELNPDSAANNLRVALHHARRGLEAAGAPPGVFLVRESEELRLGPPGTSEVDVEAFSTAVSRAWQSQDPVLAERAATLYSGDLLPADPYEDWASTRRESLRASYLTLLGRLAGLYEERGELARAVEVRERVLAADPLEEATHAALMRLQTRMGNPGLALAVYARLAALLERELGTTPDEETRALAAAIRAADVALLAAATPISRLAGPKIAVETRLPAAIDILVGRERELAELARLLGSERLITLTGPGGIGKTRLAQEAARDSADRFPQGVTFVDLATLHDAALVVPTIARTLGVKESAGQLITQVLAAAIGEGRLLLVLDNLEQVVAAAPELSALVRACPNLTILATSRTRLRVRGEQEYPVAPLPVPELQGGDRVTLRADIEETPAVVLFVHRARSARSSFVLTNDNADAVAAVCRRLDGLPLAIELAAARVRVLAPDQLRRRLARPLDLLGSAAQDVPARQRTLRETIAWSLDLLAPPEQALFRRVSVFVGGCTLEGVEAVTRAFAQPEIDVVDALTPLIEQHLLRAEEQRDGSLRYRMLETIRDYGLEQLAASGEERLAREAHADEFRSLAASAYRELWSGRNERVWLNWLESEHDNMRAALEQMLASGSPELLGFAADLAQFWWLRGHFREARTWLERALAVDKAALTGARAQALRWLGKIVATQGEARRGLALMGEGLDLARALGDREQEAASLGLIGTFHFESGDIDRAETHFLHSLDLYRQLGFQTGVALRWWGLSSVAEARGDLPQVESLATEALRIFRELEDATGAALCLHQLGRAAKLRGDLDRAKTSLEEALALFEDLGNPEGVAEVADVLGDVARERGDLEKAGVLFARSQAICEEIGWWPFAAFILYRLATVAADGGDLTAAADLGQRSCTELRQTGWKWALATALCGDAQIRLLRGDSSGAADELREGLALFRALGDPLGEAHAVRTIACLAAHLGWAREAARLLAAAAAKRELHGAGLAPSERQREADAIVRARRELGQTAFTAARKAGRMLPWTNAVEEALATLS